jgi:hypothetical protein
LTGKFELLGLDIGVSVTDKEETGVGTPISFFPYEKDKITVRVIKQITSIMMYNLDFVFSVIIFFSPHMIIYSN